MLRSTADCQYQHFKWAYAFISLVLIADLTCSLHHHNSEKNSDDLIRALNRRVQIRDGRKPISSFTAWLRSQMSAHLWISTIQSKKSKLQPFLQCPVFHIWCSISMAFFIPIKQTRTTSWKSCKHFDKQSRSKNLRDSIAVVDHSSVPRMAWNHWNLLSHCRS